MNARYLIIFLFLFFSCELFKYHDQVENVDVKYLENLGLISVGEKLIWFDSQLTQKESGNFLTNKRIASYWIDKSSPENSYRNYFMLEEVDSVQLKDHSNSLSYASYFMVYSDKKKFKVFVDKNIETLHKYEKLILDLIKQ